MNSFGTKSYLACSIAALLGTGTAVALPPSTTVNHTIYIGGGSAEPQPVQAAVCQLLTNVDVYTDSATGANSGDYLVLFGSAKAAMGNPVSIASGDSVMVIYGFKGGSYINGAIPQSGSGSNLTYPANSAITSAPATGTGQPLESGCSTAATPDGAPTYSYTAGATVSALPDFGITDLEATAFSGINLPAGTTVANIGAPDSIYDLVEGVAVTANLYAAKSRWTSNEIAQILTGAITDWALLTGDSGAPLNNTVTNAVTLLDRNVGSGTKAAGTSFFLNYPGGLSSGTAKEPQSATGLAVNSATKALCTSTYTCYVPFISTTSFSSFSTSVTGYQDIQDTSSSAVVSDLMKAQAAGMYAIAILSADNSPYLHQVGSANTYDFVEINGEAMDLGTSTDNINGTAHTSYDNVITGAYGFFYQVAFNTRSGFLATGTGSDQVDFSLAMKTALQSDTLAGANSGNNFPLSAPGIVIDADIDHSSSTKGVTIATRNKLSTAPLVITKFGVTITPANDPL
jgi:hypothetical protein